MRVQARLSGIIIIGVLYSALAVAAFYGAAKFLLNLFGHGYQQLDLVEWTVSAIVALLPFIALYLIMNMLYACLVSFDERGVYQRTLTGIRFTPWSAIKKINVDLSFGRVEIQAPDRMILFTPLAFDISDYNSGIHWLKEKAAMLKGDDT